MTEKTFNVLFNQFLNGYWGAFHEALEAQSVTSGRLAASLFHAVQAEHNGFEGVYPGPARAALAELGAIWRENQARRYEFPDAALTHDQIARARQLFEDIFDSLVHEGEKYAATCEKILGRASHGTPRDALKADAAR